MTNVNNSTWNTMFYQMKLTHAEALIQRIIEKSDDIKVGLDNTKVIMHHASLYMTSIGIHTLAMYESQYILYNN
jgi:hypothetical protein